MTSNTKADKKDPLLDIDNTDPVLCMMQKKFIELMKCYDEIEDYERKLDEFSQEDYNKLKIHVHSKIQILPEQFNKISSFISTFNSSFYDDPHKKMKAEKQVKLIQDKLAPKQENLNDLISRIIDKEGKLDRRRSTALTCEDLSTSMSSFKSDLFKDDVIQEDNFCTSNSDPSSKHKTNPSQKLVIEFDEKRDNGTKEVSSRKCSCGLVLIVTVIIMTVLSMLVYLFITKFASN